MEQSDDLWTRYSEALMVSKFSLRKDSSHGIKILSSLFIGFQALEIRRRVIELHAYIRYCGLDSKLLAVIRFLDSMHKQSRTLSSTLDKTGIVQYFDDESSRLSSLMIESLYTTICYDVCQERANTSRCSNILGEMSSYYHAMVSHNIYFTLVLKSIKAISFHSDISPCYERIVFSCSRK